MKIKYLLLLSTSGTVISLDMWTKHLILKNYHLGQSNTIIKNFFSFTYVRNPGAAFGFLNTWDPQYRIPFFIAIPILALLMILYFFKNLPDEDRLVATALSLIMGGAIGNLIDRISFNYVVDFLDFYWGEMGPHFPAFNIADTAISVGVGLFILDMLKKNKVNASNSI